MSHRFTLPTRAQARFAFITPLAAALLAFASSPFAAADQLTFAPTADATVKAAFPGNNFGTDTNLQVSTKSGFQKHIFAKFTVSGIPTGATGISATVKLTSQTTVSGTSIATHSVSSTSWGETTITWNNQPSLGSTLSTVSSVTSGSVASWNVSGEVTGNGTYTIGFDTTYATGDITFGSRESSTPPSLVVTYTAATTGVSVINGNLALDGTLWIPNGLQILAWVAPDGIISGQDLTAQQHWGQSELNAGKNNWKADMIRMQISICGLDPTNNSIYGGTTYINEITNAVTLARNSGYEVILSMQHEPPSGCQTSTNLPEADVQRAWQTLIANAPSLATDPYVMFEDYNEPIVPGNTYNPTATMWSQYQNGDSSLSPALIGHQQILNTIRTAETAAGSVRHLVIFEGLIQGHVFENAPQPLITDISGVSGKIAYGIHPYFNAANNSTSSEWDANFGNWHGAGNAVLATEWGAASKTFDCNLNDPTWTANFIPYLRGKNIGLNVMAFDILDDMTVDWSWNPNLYDSNFSCGSGTEGPGTDVQNDWIKHPGR